VLFHHVALGQIGIEGGAAREGRPYKGFSPRPAKRISALAASILVWLCLLSTLSAAQSIARSGVVLDQHRGAVANARLTLKSSLGVILHQTVSTADGRFSIEKLPAGSYWLEVTAPHFETHRMSLALTGAEAAPIEIVLSVSPLKSEITITAQRGAVAEIEEALPIVAARNESDIRSMPIATIGNALAGMPGVMIQQSTYGQVSPFLRGLSGYHVLNLIDGIRFNNSTFRSGPNQYLAFVEPSQVQRIEAMLGPASSQFGSDALGGAIQLFTPVPHFTEGSGLKVHGELNVSGSTADASVGSDAHAVLAAERATFVAGGTWRKINDLRAGRGHDSHHVLRRFFGLSGDQISDIIDNRLQESGFTPYGFHTRFALRTAENQSLTLWYQRAELDRVRGYKDLWGGLGRLRSDFEPQGLHFFYTRYEALGIGALDSLSGTFSINSQADGSIRQGLRATDRIIRDESRVDAFGYAVQGATHIGRRQAIVFGGEIYDEHIDALREETVPATGASEQKRALYPNGSRYRTYGLFIQDTVDLIRASGAGGLRANIGGRFTRVGFKTFADRNRDAMGRDLGVADAEQSYQDWTFNTGLTWQATEVLALNFLVNRGFRAPNLNDLGALGLNDLGYEVPAEATIDAEGWIGTSDGEGALSNGRRVTRLRAERLLNYEAGLTTRFSRFYARAHVFDAELKDPIVRRSLLFPIDRPPTALAGVPVTTIAPTAAQRAQGFVSVATSLDPRAVKAFVNEGRARYYGVDALFNWRVSTRWSAEGNYSYLVGRELNPNRHVRRLPPQQGYLAVRFQPGGPVAWVEASADISGPQKRLSGGDLTDERIGAARRRQDITDFFNGTLISPFIHPGADDRQGTADDVFGPTGETVAQIRDRVLPIGATINGVRIVDDTSRAPLYLETPGFLSLNLRSGLILRENLYLNLALMNIADRNYRTHGSGVDAPGINFYARLKFSF
jgi:outer membrane receptor protein involved in Fe transport